MYSAENIIQRKRDGCELEVAEIRAFVAGISSGEISDAQIAAFTMATWFNGMAFSETSALTLAMRDSGRVLAWPDLDGPVLDKHSTGGVGDLVSLVLGPVLAACGAYVPMISGRGLGHTGGTLDKLESIPGFDTTPGTERFIRLVHKCGVAVVGQSEELAPADRRLYAVRDVTATVSSPPLMISSILSKKLAEGLDGLVLDIKYGSGAFSGQAKQAVALAQGMCRVANTTGLACNAVVSNMDEPLARSAGNALEVLEAIRFLCGDGVYCRLHGVTLPLCAELLWLGGLADSFEHGIERAQRALDSGAAAERFAAMVAGQGGPADLLENPQAHLASAALSRAVYPTAEGIVQAIDTRGLGRVVVTLGGGRLRGNDRIDPSVGLSGMAGVGENVGPGQPLAIVHARDEAGWEAAAAALLSAFTVSEKSCAPGALIHEIVRGDHADDS